MPTCNRPWHVRALAELEKPVALQAGDVPYPKTPSRLSSQASPPQRLTGMSALPDMSCWGCLTFLSSRLLLLWRRPSWVCKPLLALALRSPGTPTLALWRLGGWPACRETKASAKRLSSRHSSSPASHPSPLSLRICLISTSRFMSARTWPPVSDLLRQSLVLPWDSSIRTNVQLLYSENSKYKHTRTHHRGYVPLTSCAANAYKARRCDVARARGCCSCSILAPSAACNFV